MDFEPTVECAVVIPVYNEEAIVERNLKALAAHFDRIVGPGKWRAAVVDNNSADATASIIDQVGTEIPAIQRLHQPVPDFGKAVALGLENAATSWSFVLSIDEWDVPFLCWAWARRNDFDLFVGTKRADPTINDQAPYRRVLSWGLNALLQLLLDFTGTDTHGPKLLNMRAMAPVLADCVMSRGQFDTEFVLKAQRRGLRVVELPVAYAEQRPPRNLMIRKIARNVRDLFRLYGTVKAYPYAGSLRLYRFPRDEVVAEAERLSDKAE